MSRLEPAPFPTECAPHNAAHHANPQNARAHPPHRPVSSKSRRPRKAERGVHVIARDPQCWLYLSSINQRAYRKCPQGQRGTKLALVVVFRRGQHGEACLTPPPCPITMWRFVWSRARLASYSGIECCVIVCKVIHRNTRLHQFRRGP